MNLVADRRELGGHAGTGSRLGKHGVGRSEHRPGRAEGFGQGKRRPRPLGGLGPVSKAAMGGGKRAGVGALEAEDRLFLVADREQGARRGAGAPTGEEFFRQGRDHGPLRRTGVLRLVDQQVIEAAVELVEHPGRDARAGQ